MIEQTPERTLTRRSVVKGAAWAAPVLALAVATPAATASGTTDVSGFTLEGSCGVLGLIGPGFDLTAGTAPLPVGTTVTVTGEGLLDIGLLSTTGGLATVGLIGDSSQVITLTSELPAGQTLAARMLLSISAAYELSATVALPAGYTATSSKPTASIEKPLLVCRVTS